MNETPNVEYPPEGYDRYEPYIPKEYRFTTYRESWKKCRCGRVAQWRDRWCPTCGQKLGTPIIEYKDGQI